MKQTYLECGKIINIHGFRGTVKLESYCDSPKVLSKLPQVYFKNGETYLPNNVQSASVFKDFVLMTLENVSTEQEAKALVGTVVYAHRKDLPVSKNSHFVADIIGLPVKHAETGAVLGKVADLQPGVASDLYEIETPNGKFLVPGVAEFVKKVDPDDAVYLLPIPGLLDAEDKP